MPKNFGRSDQRWSLRLNFRSSLYWSKYWLFLWLDSFSTNFLGHRFNLNFLLLLNFNLFFLDGDNWFNLFLNLFDFYNWCRFDLFLWAIFRFCSRKWKLRDLWRVNFVICLLWLCGFSQRFLWLRFSFFINKTLFGNLLPNCWIFGLLFLIWVHWSTLSSFSLLICDGGFKNVVHKLIFALFSLYLVLNFRRLRNWFLHHSLWFLFWYLNRRLFLLLFWLRSRLWFRLFFTIGFRFLSQAWILLF